ncbi:unnamed protein product, partial [Rotaria socialis]
KKTPFMVEFSTATYRRQCSDSARSSRSIAMKIHTDEEEYNIFSVNFLETLNEASKFILVVLQNMLANTLFRFDHSAYVDKGESCDVKWEIQFMDKNRKVTDFDLLVETKT